MVVKVNEGYLTIPEIHRETGIPESTVRRYLDQHNHALRTKKNGRGAWLLKTDDTSLMLEIRKCYEQKMSVTEVENYLLQSGQPITITIDDEQEDIITPAQAFMQLAGEVQTMQRELLSTQEQLAAAHEEITSLKKQQTVDSEEQSKWIMTVNDEMKSMSEGIKTVSDGISRLERERNKREERSFWKRLFRR